MQFSITKLFLIVAGAALVCAAWRLGPLLRGLIMLGLCLALGNALLVPSVRHSVGRGTTAREWALSIAIFAAYLAVATALIVSGYAAWWHIESAVYGTW